MKTLTEIQQEIEGIKNGVAESLSSLQNEIAETEKSSRRQSGIFDFDEIRMNAKASLFKEHPLCGSDIELKKHYLTLLFSAVQLEKNAAAKGLIYVFRIGMSVGCGELLEELFVRSAALSVTELDEAVTALRESSVRDVLAVDMLILSGKYLTERNEAWKYISELFVLMDIRDREVDFAVKFARVMITENIDGFVSDSEFLPDKYACYISACEPLSAQIGSKREIFYCTLPVNWDFDHPYYYNDAYYIGTLSKCDYTKTSSAEGFYFVDCILDIYNSHYSGSKGVRIKVPVKEQLPFKTVCNINSPISAIGYYHPFFDLEKTANEWFSASPHENPLYSYMNIQELGKVSEKNKWDKTYSAAASGSSIGDVLSLIGNAFM